MADPIKYGWLPDTHFDAKLNRWLYGWRAPDDKFMPNELARGHFANVNGRKTPYGNYDEYWGSFGQKQQNAPPISVPFDDDQSSYAKRYRAIFKNQPVPKRPPPQPVQPVPQKALPQPSNLGLGNMPDPDSLWGQALGLGTM